MDLIDIGANLTHDSFDPDRAQVMARAAAAGVRRMVVTGTTVSASRQALALAAEHPQLSATAGVHPHHSQADVVGVFYQCHGSIRPLNARWYEKPAA